MGEAAWERLRLDVQYCRISWPIGVEMRNNCGWKYVEYLTPFEPVGVYEPAAGAATMQNEKPPISAATVYVVAQGSSPQSVMGEKIFYERAAAHEYRDRLDGLFGFTNMSVWEGTLKISKRIASVR